ncbi:MAG: hypothetical protein ACC656_03840, partial [Candidatus Heimdallarchaeota archaeon]
TYGLVFEYTFGLLITALGILSFSTIRWVYVIFIDSKNFKTKYVKQLQDAINTQIEEKRKDLKRNLLKNGCSQGAKQLIQFKNKFETLIDILQTKFYKGQLTYQRYYGTAQEVYLSGIDNLNSVVMSYKALESIDTAYMKKRLTYIQTKNYQNDIHLKKEFDAIKRAVDTFENQNEKIKALLAENITALVQIDETTIAISQITRTKNNEAQIDMENSMNALVDLAKRSQLYSR